MIIGIVDDNKEKRQCIERMISSIGGDITIIPCRSLNSARRLLHNTTLDLLILDIALPHHDDGEPVLDGGIDFLSEVISNNRYKMPKQIIGLTALAEIYETAATKFGSEMWSVLFYDRTSSEWSEQLLAKVRHLLRLQATSVLENNHYDIGIVVALKSPELDSVLQLPWNWTVHDQEADTTVYYRGHFKRKDGSVGKAIVARSGLMGMPAATALATKLGLFFRPKCLAMVGICAGNKEETSIGDLVVANPTWDYGSGKYSTKEGIKIFEPAPYPLSLSTRIRNIIDRHEGETDILNNIRSNYPQNPPRNLPKLHIGPFASGAAVIARGAIIQEVKTQQHRKLLAIDMEAYGVAMAASELQLPQPDFIAIKGISDFADEEKGDSHREYAAYMSAQFLGILCTDYGLC